MVYFLLYIAILIVPILEQYVSFLSFFDEGLTILFFIGMFYQKQVDKRLRPVLYCLVGILVIGMLSSFYFDYQKSLEGILKDALAISKFPIAIYSLSKIRIDRDRTSKSVETVSRIASVIVFSLGLVSLFANIGLSRENDLRFGFRAFSFLYAHPTFLVISLVSVLAVLIANGLNRNVVYILMTAFTIVLTFRFKAFIVLAAILVLPLAKKLGGARYRKGILTISAVGILALTYFLVADKISDYSSDEYINDAARTIVTYKGFFIAKDHFPLGTGFCTYGSYLSVFYYSPLYYKYLGNITGIQKDEYSYAADVFWPSIYVQYGFIGAVIYLTMIFVIFRYINRNFEVFSDKWIAAQILMLYAVAASTSEAFFTNPSGVFFPIILMLFIGNGNLIPKHMRNFPAMNVRV